MLIKEKIGNIVSMPTDGKTIDWLDLEWYETSKRIMHKRTQDGIEVVMKFMSENQQLTQGDILFQDASTIVAVNIQPCDAIIIRPENMYEMACICYEIGNKHLPLFFEDDMVLVAYDAPLFRLIAASGYEVERGTRKLLQSLKTSVAAHGHAGTNETLFSKIMRLTRSPE